MRGWVYVITTKAMPDLVKVGYTSKDPESRAQELYTTGTPHPFVVDYEVLVENPFQIEQRVHRALNTVHENKEWFRCTVEESVIAIKEAAGNEILLENFKKLEKIKIESQIYIDKIEKERLKAKSEAEKNLQNEVQDYIEQAERGIHLKYEPILKNIENGDTSIFGYGYFIFMAEAALLLFFVTIEIQFQLFSKLNFKENLKTIGLMLLYAIPIFGAAPLRDYRKKQRLQSSKYLNIIQARNHELGQIVKIKEKLLSDGLEKIKNRYI